MAGPSVSVVVPSYNRPGVLVSCLAGLAAQRRPPEQIIVAIRGQEAEYREQIAAWLPTAGFAGELSIVEAGRPSQTVAMNAGLTMATGEIVCFTDDDAVPRPDWLERMLLHYADPGVAAVGGRDVLPWSADAPPATQVGTLTWYGKLIGNHHIGSAGLVEVDHLKGVNMSFRRELLPRFDENLMGDVVFNEVDVCLQIRRRGYRILFDPALRVDHYPATRHVGSERGTLTAARVYENCFNGTYVLLKNLPPLPRAIYFAYTFLVGGEGQPGVLYALLSAARRRPGTFLGRAIAGKLGAVRFLYGRTRAGLEVSHEMKA